MQVEIQKSSSIPGKEIEIFGIDNQEGIRISLMTLGASLTSVKLPDRFERTGEVTLGFDTPEEYYNNRTFFGAAIGRYGNRIARGKFTLNGHEYNLAINNGYNHLHGGIEGFDRQIWEAEPFQGRRDAGVVFNRISPDMEEGYPGRLETEIKYTLTATGELKISYKARTDRETIINLTNHTFWNLAGAGSGTILNQHFKSPAEKYLPVDDTLIPLGELYSVKGTAFDFNSGMKFSEGLITLPDGWDHCLILPENKESTEESQLKVLGTVIDEKSGRKMEVFTDQPGFQLYTCGHMPETPISGGKTAGKFGAFCLETQNFPDAPNRKKFPSPVLKPGEIYIHNTVHHFSLG